MDSGLGPYSEGLPYTPAHASRGPSCENREGKPHSMKIKRFAAMTLALLLVSVLATAQIKPMSGKVLVPDSSIEKPMDIGRSAHTNIQVFLPSGIWTKPLARRTLRVFGGRQLWRG
jgi:hypothetical protein